MQVLQRMLQIFGLWRQMGLAIRHAGTLREVLKMERTIVMRVVSVS